MANALLEVAREVLAEHGLTEHAEACLAARVRADETLLALAVSQAAYDALRAAQHAERQEIQHPGSPYRHRPDLADPAVRRRLAEAVHPWLRWRLMDGTPLGEATREQVLDSAERYHAYAEGNATNARWLRLVAQKVRPGQKVSEALTGEQVERLRRRAEQGPPARAG